MAATAGQTIRDAKARKSAPSQAALERRDIAAEIEGCQAAIWQMHTDPSVTPESLATATRILEHHLGALAEKLLPKDVQTLRELQRRKAAVEASLPGMRQAIQEESDRWNSYAPVPDESICANYHLNGLHSSLRYAHYSIDQYADEIEDLQEEMIAEELADAI